MTHEDFVILEQALSILKRTENDGGMLQPFDLQCLLESHIETKRKENPSFNKPIYRCPCCGMSILIS